MQRKPGFPVANCSIKMPDASTPEISTGEEDWEPPQRRQQLINFGHSQWGFNNWSWSVSKQDLDFVDCVGNKCTAGVAAFVLVTVKSFDIHRENVGYATALGPNKGSAIHRARKCAVTNALRETLLSFGGSVATELTELLETNKVEAAPPPPEPVKENNQNVANKQEPKNSPLNKNIRKDSSDSSASLNRPVVPPAIKNAVLTPAPPVAKAHPMPANLPPAANVPRAPRPPAPHPPPQHAQHPQHPQHAHMRPNSNVSFVLPVMSGVVPPLYPPPRLAPPHVGPPHIFPNAYYEYSAGPWHFTYESFDRHHSNVNLNFNIPPKNLVVNSRSGSECKNACVRPAGLEGEPVQYGAGQDATPPKS
ncbi:DNA repair protein RAD52-like [Papilio machaon]|uniref:DNA repair protein RAD52-like n=1 Tax=Papilio machaon TaxID=76193 RepID=A0A194QZK8_PAPMA|nr:DNA repair protein RAD52-like [Papilio machaon]